MNKSLKSSQVKVLCINTKLYRTNTIHIIVDIALQEEIQSFYINFEHIFTCYYIVEYPFSLTVLLRKLINLEAIDLEGRLQDRDQLRYLLLVFVEVPEPQLLLIGDDQFVVEIVEHHVRLSIGAELKHALLGHEIIFVDFATNGQIHHIEGHLGHHLDQFNLLIIA
jgi:hypothetical protein